jgi:integration host factor subunit beta
MNKNDLIIALEKHGNINHVQSELIINVIFESMIKVLYEDDRVEIRGFGSFANRNYRSYEGRNPRTGEKIKVSPKKCPFFKIGKEFKKIVDEGKYKYIIREG